MSQLEPDIKDCTCGDPERCKCIELEEEMAERAAESRADDRIEREWIDGRY